MFNLIEFKTQADYKDGRSAGLTGVDTDGRDEKQMLGVGIHCAAGLKRPLPAERSQDLWVGY